MTPSPEQLERITAYLDGELSAEESAQVEQRLASDETFRQQLQSTERAWSALDELPMTTVGDDFSRTTMELVVTTAKKEVDAQTVALPVLQRKNRLRTILLATTVALLSVVAMRVLLQSPNRRLVADLPVIQNIDIYSQLRSVSFLRDLHQELSEKFPITPSTEAELETARQDFQRVASSESRHDWLGALQDDQQVTLRAKANRFRDLSAERQEEMRALHRELVAAEDRDTLLLTLFRYEQWLNGMSPSNQYELGGRTESDSQHAAYVAKRMKQDASELQFELTPAQLRQLQEAVRPVISRLMREHQPEFEGERSRRSDRGQGTYRDRPRQEQFVRALYSALKDSPERVTALNDAIIAALPTEMRPAFEQLSARDKAIRFGGWMRQARVRSEGRGRPGERPGSREIPEQELSDFFVDELKPEQKERLLALPREQMRQQLERLYFNGQMRDNDRRSKSWGENPGPQPSDRPPGNRDDRERRPPEDRPPTRPSRDDRR